LCAVLPVSTLPQSIIEALPDFGELEKPRQFLLLTGNSGTEFWRLQKAFSKRSGAADNHPVDRYALAATTQALTEFLPTSASCILYPQLPETTAPRFAVSLQTLGQRVGWHQASPLGIGIHPQHGLWFAYRSLVLLDCETADELGEKPLTSVLERVSSCADCESHACIQACPAQALTYNQVPDMGRCVAHRREVASTCASQCLAREACPIGQSWRYSKDQIDYHYSVSLQSILAAQRRSS